MWTHRLIRPGPRVAVSASAMITRRTGTPALQAPPVYINFLAFCLRFFSVRSHKWQNAHSAPFLQPFAYMKAQGLHSPALCPREPMEGSSAVPGAGSLGGGGARPCQSAVGDSQTCRVGSKIPTCSGVPGMVGKSESSKQITILELEEAD